jgi:hypothetical protein
MTKNFAFVSDHIPLAFFGGSMSVKGGKGGSSIQRSKIILFPALRCTLIRIEFHFPEAYVLGCNFNQFILGDEFNGLIQRERPRRPQGHGRFRG